MSICLASVVSFAIVPYSAHAAPAPAYKQNGLVVVCQGISYPPPPTGQSPQCDFYDAMNEVKLLMNYAFIISLPITLIFVTWTGIQILLSQGNPSKIKDAKDRAMKVLIGFIFILAAWLIVYTIVHYFLQPTYYQNQSQ